MTTIKIEVKREGLKRLSIVLVPVIIWALYLLLFWVCGLENNTGDWIMSILLVGPIATVFTCAVSTGLFFLGQWVYKGFVE